MPRPVQSHLHLVQWGVPEFGPATLLLRTCSRAGRREHQPFGPVYSVTLPTEFWLDDEVMAHANDAWATEEADAFKALAHEARQLGEEPLPGM